MIVFYCHDVMELVTHEVRQTQTVYGINILFPLPSRLAENQRIIVKTWSKEQTTGVYYHGGCFVQWNWTML